MNAHPIQKKQVHNVLCKLRPIGSFAFRSICFCPNRVHRVLKKGMCLKSGNSKIIIFNHFSTTFIISKIAPLFFITFLSLLVIHIFHQLCLFNSSFINFLWLDHFAIYLLIYLFIRLIIYFLPQVHKSFTRPLSLFIISLQSKFPFFKLSSSMWSFSLSFRIFNLIFQHFTSVYLFYILLFTAFKLASFLNAILIL